MRNIIWDFDGTLFDTYRAINRAFQLALIDLGTAAPYEEIAALTRFSLTHCLEVLSEEKMLDPAALETAFAGRYRNTTPEDQPLFAGVRPVLDWIIEGDGLNLIFTHRGRESAAALLEFQGIGPLFAELLAAEDGYPRKPDPAGFLALLKTHKLASAETMAIGDRALDIEAGAAAGLFTCFFGTPPESISADLHIEDYQQLYDFLAAQEAV